MDETRNRAIVAIALFAAFADNEKSAQERNEIRRIAESLGDETIDLRSLYQDVLLKRLTLEQAVASLTDPGEQHLAYEIAVGVCDADGRETASERVFLDRLKDLMGLDSQEYAAIDQEAEQLVSLSEAAVPVSAAASASAPTGPNSHTIDEAALDRSIVNYSIINGALEILPQSWASMAIIPLQIKMVYGIGQQYGVELDRGHIKEFLAALGVGMTSQYLEQFGRKLIGGFFRKAAGRGVARLGRSATGMAMSFATTYALGQVAKRYYAGGRVMSTQLLKQTFEETIGSARQVQNDYLPQIEQKASQLDVGQVMAMVRNSH